MSHIPEMDRQELTPLEKSIVYVGWLHPDHLYQKGPTPPEFHRRLSEFVQRSGASTKALKWGARGGYHTCEICSKFSATGSFGVLADNEVFSAPTMIAHYVEKHDYSPPPEFIDAVMRCPLPGTPEYAAAAAEFDPTR